MHHSYAPLFEKGLDKRGGSHLVQQFGIRGLYTPYIELKPEDVDRIELADSYFKSPAPGVTTKIFTLGNLVIDQSGNFLPIEADVTFGKSFMFAGHLRTTMSALMSIFSYGVLHLIAWNAPFSNKAQLILWRVSGIAIMASGGVLMAWGGRKSIRSLSRRVNRRLAVIRTRISKFLPVLEARLEILATFIDRVDWDDIVDYVGWLVFVPIYCLYAVGRVYLVVECFINLAYSAEVVYSRPTWSAYFPHIG